MSLPSDWGMYYTTCERCDREYHLSGTTVCACAPCNVDDCDTTVNTDETYTCVSCEDAATNHEQTEDAMDALSAQLQDADGGTK
jgi:hypothetical protein